MAKYPQGVSSFIPQYQPYQVDFNYVNNVLATKQDQYDKNWQAINKVYGQLYYADLTHAESIKKKDQIEKQIDFNLKRVAGLDLSLDQNATQALQIFKPFYEDTDLMYDMAYTKNAKMQKLTGQSYSTATDEKLREQASSTSMKAIDYRIEEFKNSPYDQITSVPAPKFVPYQNVNKKAIAYAKELGVSVKDFSFTKDGRFIIEQKNGQPLVGPLYKMFMSAFGNDESIKDVYRTQAYVDRKDYGYANKERLGSVEAAETEYVNTKLTEYKAITQSQLALFKNQDDTYTKNIKNLESQIQAGSKDPKVVAQLENIREAQKQNATLLTSYQKSVEVLDDGISRTANTQGGAKTDNINDLKYKVDAIQPNMMLENDLKAAAAGYASTVGYERNIKINQFQLQQERASQARSLADYKDKLETNRIILKAKLDSGEYDLVESNGQKRLVPKKELNNVEPIKSPQSVSKTEMQQKGQKVQEDVEASKTQQTVSSMLNFILKAHENGDMSDEELFTITQDMGMSERSIRKDVTNYKKFGYPSDKDSPQERRKKLQNFSSIDINEMNPGSITEITAGFKNWLTTKNKLKGYERDGDFINVVNNFNNLEDIGESQFVKRDLKIKRAEETARLLNKKYDSQMGEYMFDSDGNMRDDATVIQLLVNDRKILDVNGNVVQPGKFQEETKDYFNYTPEGLAASTLAGAGIGAAAGGIGSVPGAAAGAAYYMMYKPVSNIIDGFIRGTGPESNTGVKGEKDNTGLTKSTKNAIEDAKNYMLNLQEDNLIKTPLYGYGGNGAGKFTMNAARITVQPGAFGTDNFTRYAQLNQVIKNLPFTKDETRASVEGVTANDWNNASNEKLNEVSKNILEDLYEYAKSKKNKDGKFNVDFHPITNASLDFAGMTVKVPEKVAEKYKMKNEGKVNQTGYLSAEVYNKLIANGLSIMSKSSNFVGTDLYNNAFMDPVESRVRAQYDLDKSGVTYTNPYYDGYSIGFNQLPSGQIEYQQTVPMWDPNKNAYVSVTSTDLLSGQGLQLQQFRNNFWSKVASMNEQNNK
jgi:hypothetical protein